MADTIEIGEGVRGIPVPVLFEVPAIWRDERYARNRLAAATSRAVLPLRVVDPSELRTMPKPRVRGVGAAPSQGMIYDTMLDGAMWRRWDRGDAAPGQATLDAFVAKVLDAGRANEDLSLDLSITLTGVRGAAGAAFATGVADASTTWRADVQAEAWAREYLAKHVAFDGTDILLSAAWSYGSRGRMRHGGAFIGDDVILEMAARLPGNDADVERQADEVRRTVGLERVGGLSDDEMAPALRGLAKLARMVVARMTGPRDQMAEGHKIATWASEAADRLDARVAEPDAEPAPGMTR